MYVCPQEYHLNEKDRSESLHWWVINASSCYSVGMRLCDKNLWTAKYVSLFLVISMNLLEVILLLVS